jgi:hypothetical protein
MHVAMDSCVEFCYVIDVGHSTDYVYELWAIVQDLVTCCGPESRICLCAMGQSAESQELNLKACRIH